MNEPSNTSRLYRYDPSWHLTLETTKGTLLEIPDLFPLINSFNSVGILKKEYKFKFCFAAPKTVTTSGGSKEDRLFGPWGVALARNGDMLIVDHVGGQVMVFDPSKGELKRSFPELLETQSRKTDYSNPTPGEILGPPLRQPIGLVLDHDQNVYVAEYTGNSIKVFDFEGKFLRQFSQTNGGMLQCPYDIALNKDGQLLVADSGSEKIHFFTLEGLWIKAFLIDSKPNSGHPTGVRVAPNGDIVVCRYRDLLIYTPDGKLIRKVESQADSAFSLDIDGMGSIILCDYQGSRIKTFASEGEVLMEFGRRGSKEGELNHPESVAIDRYGNLIVTEMGNRRQGRVSVWG